MNKRKGRILIYLIVGLVIPLLIYLIYSSTEGFWFTGLVAVIGIVTEVIYAKQINHENRN